LNKPFACTVIKSLRWPGAYAFATGTASDCVYIGNGFKQGGDLNLHTPSLPPQIQADPAKEPKQSIDPSTNNEQRVRSGQDPIKEGAEEEGEGEGEDDD